jgi:hypothetical protein
MDLILLGMPLVVKRRIDEQDLNPPAGFVFTSKNRWLALSEWYPAGILIEAGSEFTLVFVCGKKFGESQGGRKCHNRLGQPAPWTSKSVLLLILLRVLGGVGTLLQKDSDPPEAIFGGGFSKKTFVDKSFFFH